MSKRKGNRVEYAGVVESVQGKLGGQHSNESGRIRFGKKELYHWNPDIEYKEVAKRRAENAAFGEAVKACSAIMKNETRKAAYEAMWKENPEEYLTLRGYLIAKIRKGEIE